MMDFKTAAIFGGYISKDHAEPLFRLLLNYQDISASEAASRLGLHIRTVQEFLEAMAGIGIIERKEVIEKKRPYNRYRLIKTRIDFSLDLSAVLDISQPARQLNRKIRERKNAGARFTTARYDQWISNVVIWIGEGRERKERKINLTVPQGKFLFHLPFPNAAPMRITHIMEKAGINQEHASEIMDIVNLLEGYRVVETIDQ